MDLNSRIDAIPSGGSQQTVFYCSNIQKHLLTRISRATHIWGCVAWLSNKPIIDALCGKQGLIIIQSENFEPYLLDHYRRLSKSGLFIKQFGTPSFGQKDKQLMHNKFVLLGNGNKPSGLWTGSFNFTVNATQQLENAVYTSQKKAVSVAFQYFAEINKSGFCQLI